MAPSDDAEEVQRALDRLQQLGLSTYEAQTLVNLLRLGTGTAQDITRINNVPRTRVYEAADTLHELGLIDIQYTTPRKFTIISTETITRMFNVEREQAISELSEALESIGPAQPQREQYGVWTVTGRDAIESRVGEFIDSADQQIVYMTIDSLLTDEHISQLQTAADENVDIYLAGISDSVQDRIMDEVPGAKMFETLWEWADTSAGQLLITDEETALISALVNGDESFEETAIWGAGDRNSLVVVLRAIFTWRLETAED